MLFNNRDETRKVFFSVWQKVQVGKQLEPMESIIADVINLHPEYQKVLEDEEEGVLSEFKQEQGMTNPFLHMGLHIALREQLAMNKPDGIKQIYEQLSRQYPDIHQLEHNMIDCLAEALWLAQRNNTLTDEKQYLDNLKRLLNT